MEETLCRYHNEKTNYIYAYKYDWIKRCPSYICMRFSINMKYEDLMANALSGGVCMKKVNGLTKRTAAMLMSGMLYFNDSHNYQRNSKNREPPMHS